MRLEDCFFADAVTVAEGKFYVHGGGITRVMASALPFPIHIAFLVRLALSEEEVGGPHAFAFTFVGPDEAVVGPPLQTMSTPTEIAPLAEGEERFQVIAVTVAGMAFSQVGPHRLEVRVDGELLGSTALAVVLDPAAPPPPSPVPDAEAPDAT